MKKLIIVIVLGLIFQHAVLPVITDVGTKKMAEVAAEITTDKADFINRAVNGV